jgi:hypothetical protein
MGLFKDMRNLQKQAKEMVPPEHRGVRGGFRAMKDGVAQASDLLGSVQADAQRAQHLMTNGREGTATITGVRQTGMFVNESPQVELSLHVKVDGLPAYAATARQVIAQIAIPYYQPGSTVPVRVDPHDPSSLIVA